MEKFYLAELMVEENILKREIFKEYFKISVLIYIALYIILNVT